MNHLEKDKYFPFYVNFSARTSANQVQVSIKPETWAYKHYALSYLINIKLFSYMLNMQLCKSMNKKITLLQQPFIKICH